jgi:hypothetical protein
VASSALQFQSPRDFATRTLTSKRRLFEIISSYILSNNDWTDCIPDTSVKNKYNINTHCIMLFPQTPVSYVYNHLIFCKQMESVMWNINSRGNIHCTANLQPLRWNTLLNSCRHKQFDNENVTYNDAETECVCVRTHVHPKHTLTLVRWWKSNCGRTAISVSLQLSYRTSQYCERHNRNLNRLRNCLQQYFYIKKCGTLYTVNIIMMPGSIRTRPHLWEPQLQLSQHTLCVARLTS